MTADVVFIVDISLDNCHTTIVSFVATEFQRTAGRCGLLYSETGMPWIVSLS